MLLESWISGRCKTTMIMLKYGSIQIIRAADQIIFLTTLEPRYNTNVGVHKKSVLYQNSVIMRALYTGSISIGSQALTVL